jgi:hypothetical protein
MKIEADSRIPYPRERVYREYRDSLVKLVPYLPNIQEITVKEREENSGGPGRTRMLNIWRAQGDIPKAAQTIIKPEMLEWKDYALWNENDWTCEWRVETAFFTKSIKCQGKNFFIEQGGETTLQIRGELEVNLKEIPGVPRFLAGTVAPIVEKFIVALLTPNLTSVSKGLDAYMKAQPGG